MRENHDAVTVLYVLGRASTASRLSTPSAAAEVASVVSPTIFREGPYRFFFFSREEPRVHVHVASSHGNAKFWIAPEVEIAENHDIPERELTNIVKILQRRRNEIEAAWRRHFEN